MTELLASAQRLLSLARRLPPSAEDTLTVADGAASMASAAGDLRLGLEAERFASSVAYALGDIDRAEVRLRRASGLASAAHDEESWARIELSLAFVAYDRGESDRASVQLDGVERAVAELRIEAREREHFGAFVQGYRGNLARQRGSFDAARAHYAAAMSRADPGGPSVPRATFAMDLGATELAAGRTEHAQVWLQRAHELAEDLASGPSRAQLTPLIAHYRALLGLLTKSRDAGEIELDGPASLAAIRTWLFDATRGGSEPVRLDVALERRLRRLGEEASSEHARFGLGVMRALIADRGQAPAELLVARDGREIVTGARRADLREREPLRRIVEGLVAAQARGDVLDVRALCEVGWPGERITPSAAKNRVHVALSTLRGFGLGVALVRRDKGYALDPAHITVI